MGKDICDNFHIIMILKDKIEDAIKKAINSNSLEQLQFVFNDFDVMEKEIKEAKYSGQRMEDRLNDYRSCIEKLGFTRVRKNKFKE